MEYPTLTKGLLEKINFWTLNHIPSEENTQVDPLSHLGLAIDEELETKNPIHRMEKPITKFYERESVPVFLELE